jgi:hypothetical protein
MTPLKADQLKALFFQECILSIQQGITVLTKEYFFYGNIVATYSSILQGTKLPRCDGY